MSFEDCVDFAKRHPVCAVATVEGDQPRVRYFLMWRAERSGFFFHTGKMKRIYQQLQMNPKVELCFYDTAPPEQGGGRMLRVTGRVEWRKEPALVNALLEERPWIRSLGTDTDQFLAVFQVKDGEAWFWTMEDNLKEDQIPRYRF
ncbi:MAG TPA: pyridoxamine 5'-phosphate oxidase family protein [Methanolinea sp.]|nr:pyridoxamine 5'-phosphate oxidase family protein [Methanolinea sp.]HQK56752.1 pyridoxamine 5'-phosphate oxidase family protein [Methanolinea sp.]